MEIVVRNVGDWPRGHRHLISKQNYTGSNPVSPAKFAGQFHPQPRCFRELRVRIGR